MTELSVIIPVYNTDKYLQEAIESILQQGIDDMEVICVNDGSTDNSLEILNKMSEKDPRIQVYSQENQGQSVARNTGMKHATGRYLYFMDSDDILKPGCLARCMEYMEKGGYDFIFFDGEIFCEEGTPSLVWDYQRTGIYEEGKNYAGKDLMHSLLDNYTHRAVPWLLFIRHEQLKNLHLAFYPGIIHEDELFTVLLTIQTEKIGCLKQNLVKHRVRANSTMTHKYSRRNVDCYLVVIDELMKWSKDVCPQHRKLVRKFARYTLDKVFYTAQVLPIKTKMSLTWVMIRKKYTTFVSAKNWARFLLKSTGK